MFDNTVGLVSDLPLAIQEFYLNDEQIGTYRDNIRGDLKYKLRLFFLECIKIGLNDKYINELDRSK